MSQRGSSVEGTGRRGGQRSHIPFRGDDLERGKKTGKAVQQVARDSDEFEPFDQILSQADKITPKGKPRRKSSAKGRLPPVQEQDDGAVDMELADEESEPEIPPRHKKPFRDLSSPVNGRHLGSRSKMLLRHPDVDFDAIPSPSNRSRSAANTKRVTSLSNSGLSRIGLDPHSATSSRMQIDSHADDDLYNDSTQMSFTQMNREDLTGVDKENSPLLLRPSPLDKAQHAEDFGEAMGDYEIPPPESIEGLAEGDGESTSRHQRDQRSESIEVGREVVHKGGSKSKGKAKLEPTVPKRKQKTRSSLKKGLSEKRTNIRSLRGNSDDEEENGLRRSKRVRYEPLEWWRCEKVVYGRRESGGRQVVPVIKEIIRIPKEEPLPLSKKGSSRKPRSKKRESQEASDDDREEDPGADWDMETPSRGVVADFPNYDEVERRIVFTSRMLDPQPAGDGSFSYQKIFADSEFIAAGQLVVPPGSSKPGKSTKDNTYMFLLIEGAIRIRIHETDYVLATGGMFMVPRGNIYHIQNVGKRPAKLFFAQARRIPIEELTETMANSEAESQTAA